MLVPCWLYVRHVIVCAPFDFYRCILCDQIRWRAALHLRTHTHNSLHLSVRNIYRNKQHPSCIVWWNYRQSRKRSRLTNFVPYSVCLWICEWLLCASIDITKKLNAIHASFFQWKSILSCDERNRRCYRWSVWIRPTSCDQLLWVFCIY